MRAAAYVQEGNAPSYRGDNVKFSASLIYAHSSENFWRGPGKRPIQYIKFNKINKSSRGDNLLSAHQTLIA